MAGLPDKTRKDTAKTETNKNEGKKEKKIKGRGEGGERSKEKMSLKNSKKEMKTEISLVYNGYSNKVSYHIILAEINCVESSISLKKVTISNVNF